MRVVFENRSEWLEARRPLITASDAAAILGYNPKRSALDVFAAKKTGAEIEYTDQMLIGMFTEPSISKLYSIKTGRTVHDPGDFTMFFHDDFPWLAATLDRETWKEEDSPAIIDGVPLELKSAGWYKRGDWADGAPLGVQMQLQIQMACSGAKWGSYCGIVGGSEIKFGDIDRNDVFLNMALEVLEEFKWRLDNDNPPPVESPRDLGAVKLLYPHDNRDTVELGDGAVALADLWERSKRLAKEDKDQADEYEAQLRAAIGEATFGKLPDGSILSLKTTERKGYTAVVKPTTYRTLRRSNG